MAHTATLHGKHVCPKLSNDQKQECHARQVNLASDIAGAWQAYTQEVRDITQNHGHNSFLPQATTEVIVSNSCTSYKNLTPVQQEAYNAKVQVARDTKVVVMCSNPKAVSHTISTAFANMDWQWTALCAQTGLEGFYIAV
ncbi:hypothetical protein F5141DRAFT_1068073 [Pisolithus sp. B1]|nr:hypothetical protein F5141DRAFT_1068073 [Pisolithus sp. B1]